MAAPNIVAVTSIVPNTLSITPADTSRNALVTAPPSGTAYKINQIMVANIDGASAFDATVELRLADGSTFRALGSTIAVPADATLILLDKTTSLYLLDTSVSGQPSTLWATSSTASKLTFTVSFEAIT
jgi:hypothetical protein